VTAISRSEIASALGGSPYSLADDDRGKYLLDDLLPRADQLEQRCRVVRARLAVALDRSVRIAQRVTEIYESNAIEGLGTTLRHTQDILISNNLLEATAEIARYALERCLQAEPKVTDVIGLSAARTLIDQFVGSPERSLNEHDIRSIHSLILVNHPASGRYKRYLNQIEGSEHIPPVPSDVPGHMAELSGWLASTDAHYYGRRPLLTPGLPISTRSKTVTAELRDYSRTTYSAQGPTPL